MQTGKILPDTEFDVFPVVQTRSLNFFTVQRKPQRLDQMKIGSGGHTGPTNIAGVPVDLR